MLTPQIQPTLANSPVATPIPATQSTTVAALPSAPTPQQHADKWHRLLAALEGMLSVATSPEVMKLLPPKYQGYVAAVSVVEQVVTNAGDANAAITSG